ncbi:MAG: hypothetical protein K9H62_24290 [Bacteroidales bacterium]|nr:hypothetical protein [Bacteroidales bacterium]
MNLKEICHEIDLIIDGKDRKIDNAYIYVFLQTALHKKIRYPDVDLVCDTVVKMATTKNARIRNLEKDFWRFVNDLPIQIILIQGLDIGEDEVLEANLDYPDQNKKILSRLLGMSLEIFSLPVDKSKACGLRRSGAIKTVSELSQYYQIPTAKQLFLDSIRSKNADEQYAALIGLENYYAMEEEDLEEGLIDTLDEIMAETDDRTVASTCLQIQINAGIIDELSAVFQMDDWKDEHWD